MYALILPASTPFVLLATVMALSWWEDHILPAPPAEPAEAPAEGAVQEFGERLDRHGSLTEQPLSPAFRERYMTQWAVIQEQSVATRQQAVTEADALLARLAGSRGFPDADQFEDQIAALSVRHAHNVQGYRRMHAAARSQISTEEMREGHGPSPRPLRDPGQRTAGHPVQAHPPSPDDQGHALSALTRRHTK